ncbi:MAG: hypothetical protein IJD01_01900 [Clostridia bacterium]|nr:hypothetical protein [Clostridia bacterium]
METMLGILLLGVGAACAAACLVPSGDKRSKTRHRQRDRAQEREAHYMHNFRTYDGGVQEEFEE